MRTCSFYDALFALIQRCNILIGKDFGIDLHTLPYQGCIDFESLCRALGEIDYKGDLTLESTAFTFRTPDHALPEAIRLMATVAKELADKVDSYRN